MEKTQTLKTEDLFIPKSSLEKGNFGILLFIKIFLF